MGELQADGILVAAVPEAPPYFSMRAGEPEGLIAGIAGAIARKLGVEVRYVVMSDHDLIAAPDSGKAAVAFPLVPITEGGVRTRTFTDPYLVSHQRLLIAGPAGALGASRRVCTIRSEAVIAVSATSRDVRETISDRPGCLRMARAGRVDVVSGLDVHLLPMLAASGDGERYDIAGDQLSTAGIGAVVQAGSTGWADFVGAVILEVVEDGRWAALYEKTVEPLTGETGPVRPPDLTLEEAAALFPAD